MASIQLLPAQTPRAKGPTLNDLPDEVLVKILCYASEGETLYALPRSNKPFRPFWTGLRRICSAFRRVANDPQVIFPSPETRYIISSPHAIDYINTKLPGWLGIVDSYSRAYRASHRESIRVIPKISPRYVFIRVAGQWSYKGQVEFELWSQALRALPDLLTIDIDWVMTLAERRRQGCLDYLRAVVDTINGPVSPTDPTPRTLFGGVDMQEHWGDAEVRFHIFIERSKEMSSCCEGGDSVANVSKSCIANKGEGCDGNYGGD